MRIDERDKGSKVNCPLSAFEIWAPLHNKPEGNTRTYFTFIQKQILLHTFSSTFSFVDTGERACTQHETQMESNAILGGKKYQNMYCRRMPNISLISRPRGLETRIAKINVAAAKQKLCVVLLGFLLPCMEHDAMTLATRITYLSSVSQKRSMEALSKCLFVLLICRNICTNIHRLLLHLNTKDY